MSDATDPQTLTRSILTAIALDDERPALDIIEAFVVSMPQLDLRGCYTSVSEARAALAANPVDVVFLDIDMPAASGLEIAKLLPKGTQVIFTTAYSEYAVASYDAAATDYLVKPYTPARFAKAIHKALEQHALRKAARQALTQERAASVPPDAAVDFRVDYGIQRVLPSSIRYAQSLDNYVRIYRSDHSRPLTVRLTLKELLEVLPKGKFVRVHRSYVVRREAIKGIRGRTLTLEDGEIPVGATYRRALRK